MTGAIAGTVKFGPAISAGTKWAIDVAQQLGRCQACIDSHRTL